MAFRDTGLANCKAKERNEGLAGLPAHEKLMKNILGTVEVR